MKVKASDLTLDDVIEITIEPGKIRVVVLEDGQRLVREYGVDQNA